MKNISTIKNNTITYPTGVYLKYNLYLIEEYKKFIIILQTHPLEERIRLQLIKYLTSKLTSKLTELENLLIDNNGDSVSKFFNVNDWEENLREYYTTLNKIKYDGYIPLKTIDTFLRMEKLEKIKSL